MIKCVFHEQCQLHTVYRCEKHIFNCIIHSQDRFFCGNLTWQNFEVLVDLANLTGRWSVKSLLKNHNHHNYHNLHTASFMSRFALNFPF